MLLFTFLQQMFCVLPEIQCKQLKSFLQTWSPNLFHQLQYLYIRDIIKESGGWFIIYLFHFTHRRQRLPLLHLSTDLLRKKIFLTL